MKKAMRFLSVLMAFNMAFSSMNIAAYAEEINISQEEIKNVEYEVAFDNDDEGASVNDTDEIETEAENETSIPAEISENEDPQQNEESIAESVEESEIALLSDGLSNDSGTYGSSSSWTYSEEDKTLTISGSGSMYSVYATATSSPWYKYRNNVEKIIVDGPAVGDWAFYGFSSVTEVTLKTSSIGTCAFSGCTSLTEFTIPNTVSSTSSIGSNAFLDCNISTINMPAGVIVPVMDNLRNKLTTVNITSGSSIPEGAFSRCGSTLKTVSISDKVTSIQKNAFSDCTGLTEIAFPSKLTTIGETAFAGCINITELEFPATLTTIDKQAFSGCTGLTYIEFPATLTTIDKQAFSGCTGLTYIEFPTTLTSVGKYIFNNCTGIKEVVVPEGVTNINTAFYGCDNIEKATLSADLLTGFPTYRLTEIVITSGTEIPDYKLQGAFSLEKVLIKGTIDRIGIDCFDLRTVKEFYIDGTKDEWESKLANISGYSSVNSNIRFLHVPAKSATCETSGNIEYWLGYNGGGYYSDSSRTAILSNPFTDPVDHDITIDEAVDATCTETGLTEGSHCSMCGLVHTEQKIIPALRHKDDDRDGICDNCGEEYQAPSVIKSGFVASQNEATTFWYSLDDEGTLSIVKTGTGSSDSDYKMKDMSIVTNDPTAYNQPWADCRNQIKSVILDNSITYIGEYAFYGCENLSGILILPENLSSIGKNAFYNTGISGKLVIPDGVTSVGTGVFANTKITTAVLPSSLTYIQSGMFVNCRQLASVQCNGAITRIGSSAFNQCVSLSKFELPEGLTYLGGAAFAGSGIESVKIPTTLSEVSPAFSNCTSLKSLYVPDEVTTICINSFKGCSNLSDVRLPRNIRLMEGSFNGCSSIKSLELINAAIWKDAFNNCTGLKEVHISMSSVEASIGETAFQGCTSLETVDIAGCSSIGAGAFKNCTNLTHIYLPKTITRINDNVFLNDNAISIVYFDGSQTEWSAINIGSGNTSLTNASRICNCTPVNSLGINTNELVLEKGEEYELTAYPIPLGSKDYTLNWKTSNSSVVSVENGKVTALKNGTAVVTVEVVGDERVNQKCFVTVHEFGNWEEYNSVYHRRTCSCGYVQTEKHKSVTDEKEDPSCTETGLTEGKHCSVCGQIIIAQETIPANGHTEIIDKAVEANCTDTGLTEGKHCSVCKETIIAQETIPAKGHTVAVDEKVEETCTKDGKTEGKHCSVCNEVLLAQTVIKAGHKWDDGTTVTTATESKCGEIQYSCQRCPEKKNEISAPIGGATGLYGTTRWVLYSNGCLEIEDTDKVYGTSIISCAKVYGNVTSIIINDCDEIVTDSFAFEQGITKVTIKGNVSKIGENAFGNCKNIEELHIDGNVETISRNAFYACHKLKSTYISSMEKWLNINFDSEYSNPVAFSEGKLYVNNAEITEIVIPNGVTSIKSYAFCGMSDIASITLPSGITSIGTNAFYRIRHGVELDTKIYVPDTDSMASAITGYLWTTSNRKVTYLNYCCKISTNWVTDPAVEPDCETKGKTEGKHCKECNSVIVAQEDVAAKGHTLVPIPAVESTCIATGLTEGSYCSVCTKTIVEQTETEKKPHSYKTETQKATTTADGYKIVKCQNCPDEKENITYYHPTEIVFDTDAFEYDGTVKKPMVSVKDSNNGTISSDSYTVTFPDNSVDVKTYTVRVEFKGNYTGELTKDYDIKPTSLSAATLVLEHDSYDYDGTAKCPSVTVTLNSKELNLNTDYTVDYSNNINAGTATVKVTGTNNYKGEATKTFDISDEFDIEYNLDGGINNVSNSSTYKSSVGLTLSNPEKTGYTFKGWYTEDTFKNQKSKINIGEYGDISLYAKWDADEYSATLDACGGTLNVESVKIVYDQKIGELPTPEKSGFDFVGWYTAKEDGTEITKETISKYTSNTTFYAHWDFIHYSVSFDANGGTTDAEPLSVTVDEEYGELPVASKPGYDFDGWYTEKEEGTKITSESKLPEAKNQTVYAHWNAKNITVSVDANGGECTESSINVTYDSSYGELPVATRTGYEFLGWFEEGKDDKINSTDIIEKTEEYTITAHWKANEYILTFDSQGGTSCDEIRIVYDSTYGELPQTSKFSAAFDGWYTAADGGTKVIAEDIVKVTANQTLYAHWTLKYSVSNPAFSIESGTELTKGTKVSIATETNGVKIYYSLDGSDPVVADENLYVDSLIINSPVTIKAVAIKEGYANSEIVSATYTIKDESADWGDVVAENQVLYANANEIPETLWITGVSDQNYTGKAITFPEMRVYYHKQLLKNGTDYTAKYASNIKAGNATVTITGKGNYSGTIVKTFKVNPLSLGDGETNNESLKALDITLAYTGKVQKGTTVVTYMVNGTAVTLKSGTDFTYQYSTDYDYKTAGDHYIIIKGKGNFSGAAKFKETIDSSKKLIAKMKLSKMSNMNADGTALTPDVVLMDGTYKLVKDTDYTLEWQNNVLPGTATVIITGKNNYAGTKATTFKINAIAISKAAVSGVVTQSYTGNKTSQSGYSLTYKASKNATAETLEEGRDYTVSYSNEINAGNKATIIFTGINRFSGTLKKTYTITPYVLSDGEVTPANIGTVSYQKNGATPVITVTANGKTLKNGTDYTLKYSNNKSKNDGTNSKSVPTVTITGKGNYKGTITRTFKIEGSSLDVTKMTATDIAYAQKVGICKPTITLYDTNNTKLAAGTDYDKTNIKYEYAKDVVVSHIDKKKNVTTEEKVEGSPVDMKNDIIPVGAEIKVTVYGKGNYAGTEKSTIFRFVKADISKATIKVNAQGYTGYELTPSKDELSITIGSGKNAVKLAKTDYEIVSYSANTNKGKASITIHGLGNYGGTKTINFTINPKSMNYTIVFDKNSSSATGTMKNASITEGKALTANAYKWTGHTFKGWSYTPDGKVVFNNKDKFVDPTGRYGRTITLYAIWN